MLSDRNSERRPFEHPTGVFLYGPPGALLDWVAWAFAAAAPGGYHWTEVRPRGQSGDPLGPVARGVIPEALVGLRDPQDLALNHAAANAAITAGIRPDEHRPALDQLSEFLRLPDPTRALIASRRAGSPPLVAVVSNGHRLLPLYTETTVRATLQTLTSHGIAVFDVFPEVPTEARFVFANVWRLNAWDPHGWRKAVLEVERADPAGPIPAGRKVRLEDLPTVAAALGKPLDALP